MTGESLHDPAPLEPIDLKTASVEEATDYVVRLASIDIEDRKNWERRGLLFGNYYDQRAALFEEDVPKAIEIVEALGRHPEPECRVNAAYSLTRLINVKPERGLTLALKLLIDPAVMVVSAAEHHLSVEHFEHCQPVIDGEVVRKLLLLAGELAHDTRRNDDSR